MLTFPQIAKTTPNNRRLGSQYVKLLKVKTGYDDQGLAFIVAQSYSTKVWSEKQGIFVNNPNRDKYLTHVQFLDRKLHCKLSCSCPDFMYREEYALHKKGAADIEYSNGEPPTTTNPKQQIFMCKHLYKVYTIIKDKLKTK